MTEIVAGEAVGQARAWWLVWPPSVDEAVLRHGRAVGWLTAGGVALSVVLWWLHAMVRCGAGFGSCGFVGRFIDPWVHGGAWLATLVAALMLLLAYAEGRHAMRKWRLAVPFAPRRPLLAFAVEEGTLPERDLHRLDEAYARVMAGDTFSERLQIRADVLIAVGWTLAAAAGLAFTALVLALVGGGGDAATAVAGATLILGAAASWLILAGRRVAVMAFDAGKWERHTAHVLLERALAKVKVKPDS